MDCVAVRHRRSRGAVSLGASIKVVTTGQREGYLRKNGVPYSERAVFTDTSTACRRPTAIDLLLVTSVVEDPVYLSQPFYTSSHFKKEADDSKWSATPCYTAPPLPTTLPRSNAPVALFPAIGLASESVIPPCRRGPTSGGAMMPRLM